MRVGWYLGMPWREYRALTIVDRRMLEDALDDWIQHLNDVQDPKGKGK